MVSMRSEKPICALGRSLGSFPNVAIETVSSFVWLMMALSGPAEDVQALYTDPFTFKVSIVGLTGFVSAGVGSRSTREV